MAKAFQIIARSPSSVTAAEPAAEAPFDEDMARAIALLAEGVLTKAEFHTLTGIDPGNVLRHLADSRKLAAVQRCSLQLRNSGTVARLGALRHAREAVEVAAQIMRDPDMHPSSRLNAATFIAKASGIERPPPHSDQPQERCTIVIKFGCDRPPVVVSAESAYAESGSSALSTS